MVRREPGTTSSTRKRTTSRVVTVCTAAGADDRGAAGRSNVVGQQRVERGVEDVAGGGFDGGVGAGQQRLAGRGRQGPVEAQRLRLLVAGSWSSSGAGKGVGADGESVGGVAELAGEQR